MFDFDFDDVVDDGSDVSDCDDCDGDDLVSTCSVFDEFESNVDDDVSELVTAVEPLEVDGGGSKGSDIRAGKHFWMISLGCSGFFVA